MDKVGIPRGIFYHYYGDIWKYFFKELGISYVVSPRTNKGIILNGQKYANDEMCLALKIYLGHVDYLKDKCDYILVPRVDNYNLHNQTCTNFLGVYDIVSNVITDRLLHYNIDYEKNETLKKGLLGIGSFFGKSRKEVMSAYRRALDKYQNQRSKEIFLNKDKLNGDGMKVLLVSHPYNTYDDVIGKEIVNYLNKNNIEVIYSDRFDEKETIPLSKMISKDLYFKYSKENLGAIVYCENKVDGIIFLSAFPCALDSLANEIAMRKVRRPYINLIIDDNSSFTGVETRLESFVDMIRGDNK